MDPNKLNRRITIQSSTVARGTTGEQVETPTTYHTCWAEIKSSGGNERYINQQTIASVTHDIAIRYKAGITPKMRVLYGTRIFDVLAVQDIDERHIEMRLICRELV